MSRDQSVAEHSWAVAMIALELCDVVGAYEFEKTEILEYAILHDALEAWTGDIASPVNKLIDKEQFAIGKMMGKWWNKILIVRDRPKFVVKCADLIEAIHYLGLFGNSRHATQVRDGLMADFKKHIKDHKAENRILEVAERIWEGEETYIDDYL